MTRQWLTPVVLILLVVSLLATPCQTAASWDRRLEKIPSVIKAFTSRFKAHVISSELRKTSPSVSLTATTSSDDQILRLLRIRGGLVGRGRGQSDENEEYALLSEEEQEQEEDEHEGEEIEFVGKEDDEYQYGDVAVHRKRQYGPWLLESLLPKLKDSSLYQYVSKWWSSTPPMTQAYFASSLIISLYSFCFNGNHWPEILEFDWFKIVFRLQLWRVFTGFLFFGALDIFYPLNFNFVWSQMSSLEKMSYSNPEDFAVMVLYGAALLVGIYTAFNVPMQLLGHNLSMFYAYVWSRVFEGTDVNLFGLITIKAETMPLFFCAQSLLLEQTIPWADIIGIFAGHCYYYMKGKNMLSAPKSWKIFFQHPNWKSKYDKFKNEFEV